MADKPPYNRSQEEEDDDEEEEDELGEKSYKTQKDALIFAIEVSESMLQSPPESDDKYADRDSPLQAALKCAYQVMQQRIISNPKDLMSIVLFGTEKSTDKDGIEVQGQEAYASHCYVLTDLNIPSAGDVKALRSLVEDGEDPHGVLVPSKEPTNLSKCLFLTKALLQSKAANFDSRKIFIITDNDDPHNGNKTDNNSCYTQAKDLYDMGASIELFALVGEGSKFDFSKFYDDILYRDPTSNDVNPDKAMASRTGGGTSLFNSLVANVNSKQSAKRAYFSNMPLEIGPGLTISVKGYNMIQKQAPNRSCYIWLDGESAQIAVGETARLAEDSARTVESGEVKKAYKFGGEYVYFSTEEQKAIKQWGNKCIRIIGFKDRSKLSFWASIKKSIFIFPSEEGYVGSTRVFTALWRKLLKSKKVGIAWHVARHNSNPQLVALVPSKSPSEGSSGTPFLPAGIWLFPIPFVDDVRDGPELGRVIRTTDGLTDRMNKIVQQLQLPGGTYNPARYPNPALQWHYKILQVLALEDEVPEQPDDATVPKFRAIHKRCGGYIQDWSHEADDVLDQLQEQKKIKRELEGGEEEEDERRPAKKSRGLAVKMSSSRGEGISDAELRKRFNAGTLGKLTVAELKTAMSGRGLDTKGLKKDLVDRLEQWVEAN
ncbi:SPOC like C-terminal domain-containing protein [Xylariaceae sp. FL1272]|nr:SPOC like C-terminal domain-containing protein [Xylariaceae sp. FL1272]